MSRSSRLIAGIAVSILLAACGQAGDTLTGPEGPSMDGGYSTGGNREAGQDTTTVTTTSSTGGTVASDTTGRGGYSTGGN